MICSKKHDRQNNIGKIVESQYHFLYYALFGDWCLIQVILYCIMFDVPLMVAKVLTSVTKAALARSQSTTFEKRGLENEMHMKKEKKCEMMRSQKIRMILYFYFC